MVIDFCLLVKFALFVVDVFDVTYRLGDKWLTLLNMLALCKVKCKELRSYRELISVQGDEI